jgi:hypothetical protein
MRDCPGAASPEPLIWCAQSAAAGWYDFKRNVYAALKADALLTFDEIRAGIDAAGISVAAALFVLCDVDHAGACA